MTKEEIWKMWKKIELNSTYQAHYNPVAYQFQLENKITAMERIEIRRLLEQNGHTEKTEE